MNTCLNGMTIEEARNNAKHYRLQDADLLPAIGCSNHKKRTDLPVKLRDGGDKKAVVIGLNPSHARPGMKGRDIALPVVSKVLYGLGFSDYLMLNLYTYRVTDSKQLEKIVKDSYQQEGFKQEYCTDFSKYTDWLDRSDAIIVACTKSKLGNPQIAAKKPWSNHHEIAIMNMLDALKPYGDRVWNVIWRDEHDKVVRQNCHPSNGGWPDTAQFARFPLDDYLAFAQDN